MMIGSLNCQGTERDIGLCSVDYNTSSCAESRSAPVGIDCSGMIVVYIAKQISICHRLKVEYASAMCDNGIRP